MGIKNSFLVVIGISVLIFASCSFSSHPPPPSNLIEEKEMASLLCDLSLSEALLTNDPLASFNDTLKKIDVLKEHHVSMEQFLLSFNYYSENPKKLKSIYADAVEILKKQREAKP